MQTTIEIPQIEDFNRVNELAKQVHELHVNWRPDLFLSVDEVIVKENFKEMIQAKEIFVAKIKDEIVGYITFNIKEKDNPSMRYRKQLQIEAICVDEKSRGKGIGTELLKYVRKFGKENNKVIGGTELRNINKKDGTAGGGIWLNEKYQKNGYGTEAFSARIKYAFDVLGLRRIENGYFVNNEKSKRMQEKLGYKNEGLRRKKYLCLATNEYVDECITGLLKEEFIEWKENN